MPTTPNYGFPYPALSDTPNGPVQMGNLATSIDTLFATFAAADTALTARFTNLLVNNAGSNFISTTESLSNDTFTDLATVGPTVSLTSAGTKALVLWGCVIWGSTTAASGRVAVEISGATTLAANAANGIWASANPGTGTGASGITGALYTITPGTNQFRLKYNNIAASGTGFFQNRWLFVFAP